MGQHWKANAPKFEWFDRLQLVWKSRRLLYKAFLCALVVGTAQIPNHAHPCISI